jgi:hypothetical protein
VGAEGEPVFISKIPFFFMSGKIESEFRAQSKAIQPKTAFLPGPGDLDRYHG